MSIADMNYASAVSKGNALSRDVAEHNQAIRQNNQMLVQQWNQTIGQDKAQLSSDKRGEATDAGFGLVGLAHGIRSGSTDVKGLREGVSGAIGTGMGLIEGVQDIASGKFKSDDTDQKIGDVSSLGGKLLDVASVAMPELAPVGALLSVGGAIIKSIGDIKEDKTKQATDKTEEAKEIAQNKASIMTAPASVESLGLIGNAQHAVQSTIAGSSSF